MPYERYGGAVIYLQDMATRRHATIKDEPTPEREALCEWLDFHNIPKWIVDQAVIIRDEENHRIIIKGWLSEDEIASAPLDEHGNIITKTYVEQGEAGPLPFPSAIEFVDA